VMTAPFGKLKYSLAAGEIRKGTRTCVGEEGGGGQGMKGEKARSSLDGGEKKAPARLTVKIHFLVDYQKGGVAREGGKGGR